MTHITPIIEAELNEVYRERLKKMAQTAEMFEPKLPPINLWCVIPAGYGGEFDYPPELLEFFLLDLELKNEEK